MHVIAIVMSLTALLDYVRKLFTEIKYSEKGSNERMKEEAVYMFFYDYMEDVEGG